MTTGKRFQTGREIMKAYVPNYIPPTQPLEERQSLGMRSGKEVALSLLLDFRIRLNKKQLKLTR